ncbi:MAG: GAF domain-containing sensor histidine kinase [Desulfobulbaceae bacterium]|nr:GAF domain-containing sensor histidine kinase [Desulfobulbaceae bacterium]
MNLGDYLNKNDFFKHLNLTQEERDELIRLIEKDYLLDFLSSLIQQSEEILAIDPHLPRKKILEIAAENIVRDLAAEAASIRLFDPKSFKMLTFGAANLKECERTVAIPVKKSIAGRVVEENRSIIVPSIMKNPLYKEKKIVVQKGFHSLIAVPLRMPSFVGSSDDLLGSLQIYYKEDDRHFSKHEIIRAEALARRVSYVMAKKRIIDMKALNDKKEAITDKIFIKLSNREGVKLKDIFNLLIPELEELIQLHSCSLFTLSSDQKSIRQEAAYPQDRAYHESSHLFTLDHHDYFWATVHGSKQYADMPYERIDTSYVLIKDPFKSTLVSPGLKEFVKKEQIHSILLVPMRAATETRHILCYFATQQKQYFSEDEIELLTFFGKEIMKALRLEFLGDMLHDFKNPAVAVAGLAARSRKLLDSEDLNKIRDKLISYQDVVVRETARLQDLMALTMTEEGRKEEIDLGKIAAERFDLNRHVIEETKNNSIRVEPPACEDNLIILSSRQGLERILDNLLSNATKAIPETGGYIEMRCFSAEKMAVLEIKNSGEIPQDQLALIKKGTVIGRGLNIISRFTHNNQGNFDISSEHGLTTICIKLPLHRTSS